MAGRAASPRPAGLGSSPRGTDLLLRASTPSIESVTWSLGAKGEDWRPGGLSGAGRPGSVARIVSLAPTRLWTFRIWSGSRRVLSPADHV